MGQLSLKSKYFYPEMPKPMLKKDDSTLCKHVFKWDCDMNTNNWSSYVDNFENQTTCSIDLSYEKLCDIENINWY